MAGKGQLAAYKSSMLVTVWMSGHITPVIAHVVDFNMAQPNMPEGFHGGASDMKPLWRSWVML